jgi:DNA adenine methylase
VNIESLLAACRCRSIELTAADGKLRYRGPEGALTDELRAALTSRRSEVLAALVAANSSPTSPAVPPWDQARADAVLADVHARCNRALTTGEANTAARRNVVEVCREVAVNHHRDRDPLLWDELESLEELFTRWRNPGGPPPEGRQERGEQMTTTTTTPTTLIPPLKWHGGKHYLARRIVALMPKHLHYVEPYAGGLAVLLARDPDDPRLWSGTDGSHRGVSEVVNDIDLRLMNFWRVLRDEETFARFRRQVEAIALARAGWQEAHDHVYGADPVAGAVAFFVNCRQSLAGRQAGFTSITRNRTRRGMNGNASEWLSAVEGLPAVHARLRRVVVENMDALRLIPREDGPGTLFYCDPPYVHATRVSRGVYGEHEMSEADHRRLLEVVKGCKGKAMLSGYPSALYDAALADWSRHTFELPNNAAGGSTKARMTEVLWCNF